MDHAGETVTSDTTGAGKWIGRVVIAVILGEAIWSLIVSVMNNLVVPWVGDMMGQSSGLPTSFRQRPYNYPDLFVSIFEFCIAGLVAAVLNYFFQRPGPQRVRQVRSSAVVDAPQIASQAPTPAPGPMPQAAVIPAYAQAPVAPPMSVPSTPQSSMAQTPITQPAARQAEAPIRPSAPLPVTQAPAPMAPAPSAAIPGTVAPPLAKPVVSAVPPASTSVAKPQPQAPAKPAPSKPKKPKEVYYNIVGEPVPSDED